MVDIIVIVGEVMTGVQAVRVVQVAGVVVRLSHKTLNHSIEGNLTIYNNGGTIK
jgi:hypothetical protein